MRLNPFNSPERKARKLAKKWEKFHSLVAKEGTFAYLEAKRETGEFTFPPEEVTQRDFEAKGGTPKEATRLYKLWYPDARRREKLLRSLEIADAIEAQNAQKNHDAQLASSRLVRLAQTDYTTNLMSIGAAMGDVRALFRHKKWLQQYGIRPSGRKFAAAVNSCSFILGLFLAGVTAVSPTLESAPLVTRIVFPIILGLLVALFPIVFYNLYRMARRMMVKTISLERADPMHPSLVTRLCTTHLPRLGLMGRWDIWRGNEGHTGMDDQSAFVVLQCGRWHIKDRVQSLNTVNEDGSPVMVEQPAITPFFYDLQAQGKAVMPEVVQDVRVDQLRTPLDYYNLPADPYGMRGATVVRRRLLCRALDQTGKLMANYKKKGFEEFFSKYVEFIAIGGFILGTIIVLSLE